MKVDTLKKYRNLLVTIAQTLIVILLALVITIVNCNFKFQDFNWLTFILNFLFTTVMKATYTSYAKSKEMLESETVILTNTIALDRAAIFNAQKTKEFELEVEKINKMNKLEAYINKLDSKQPKPKHKEEHVKRRNWAFEYKQALSKDEDTQEFEKQISLKSIKIDYEHIEASKLFTYGANSHLQKKKYVFNSFSSSFNRAVIPTTLSLVISVVFGAIQNDSSINTGQVWIDLAGYLFSIVLGIWWGWNNGKAIIREDYNEVLTNVSSLIREIKSKLKIEEDKKCQ